MATTFLASVNTDNSPLHQAVRALALACAHGSRQKLLVQEILTYGYAPVTLVRVPGKFTLTPVFGFKGPRLRLDSFRSLEKRLMEAGFEKMYTNREKHVTLCWVPQDDDYTEESQG